MTLPQAEKTAGSLSAIQEDYLRLVAQGMTSKEIAQSRGGSHHTVNAQIAVAMRILGARSRQEAAATFERIDRIRSYELSYEPPAVVQTVPPVDAAASDDGGEGDRGWALPVATKIRPVNTLTILQRVGWIVVIAAAVALLLGGLVSGVATLLVSLHRLL